MSRALVPVLLAPLVSVSAAHPADVPTDLQTWGRAFERRTRPTDDREWKTLNDLLIDLRGYARATEPARRRAAQALLDLYASGLAVTEGRAGPRPVEGWSLLERTGTEFESLLVPELSRWLAGEVLVSEANPVTRRVAAARLLAQDGSRHVRQALLSCVRASEPELVVAAGEALVGRDDPAVSKLFVQTLQRAGPPTPTALVGAADAHFRQVHLETDDRSMVDLESYVRKRMRDEDWRRAASAISVSAALPDDRAVPLLVGALETWGQRSREGHPVRRLLHDLARELRGRSGLDLGSRPDRWRTWWEAVQSGRVQPHGREGQGLTRASFFGLRPETDRVTFVLDRSGSMKEPFSPSDGGDGGRWTRYQESVAQMVRFLEGLGTGAHFNVVLFSDGAIAYRSELQPATPAQLRAARTWALRHRPSGGTQVRAGIERALAIDEEGQVDLEELEADTLILLCDGETAEGPSWVVPFLRRVNPVVRVVIHGVQIGSGGDGTLAQLAATTGGDFARVRE